VAACYGNARRGFFLMTDHNPVSNCSSATGNFGELADTATPPSRPAI
jgi:hypothetical protein